MTEGLFWGPTGVADMRPRLLGGGRSIVLDRQKKAIIMNGFLDWEGIGKKKKKNRLRKDYYCSRT